MIVIITLLCFIASSCTAHPYMDSNTRNVITVPPNCPEGQELVNGICRDVWLAFTAAPHDISLRATNEKDIPGKIKTASLDTESKNVISTPTNCKAGQVLVNGQCRDPWRIDDPSRNIIVAPPNCPPGQVLVNSQCRDLWRRDIAAGQDKNVKSTPSNCKPGQVLVTGRCYDLWRNIDQSRNVISVPPNCPPGQELVNGQCHDIWRSFSTVMETLFKNWSNVLSRTERQVYSEDSQSNSEDSRLMNINIANKNIINIPNQCPVGFRPDALGNCRPIM